MPEPVDFSAKSPRLGLPLLFAGQAQKEFFVNQALSLLDMLAQPAIQGEGDTPPTDPADGECWLVGSDAGGDWAGQDGKIAGWQAGTWVFAAPAEGLQLFRSDSSQFIHFRAGAWWAPMAPVEPSGGTVIDAEARLAIGDLVAQLQNAGIFAA